VKYRSYNAEFRTSTAQLLDVFSSIVIDRRDNKNVVQELIRVPCVFGQRDRVLKSLENRDKTLKIPLITLSVNSMTRDNTRAYDLQQRLRYQGTSDGIPQLIKNSPVPMNIGFTLSIVTKTHSDLDQIVSNFIPFCNPDFYVVWPHPKQPTKNIKSQVVWDGDLQVDWPEEVTENDPYRIIANTQFTYKTWIFPGMGADPDALGNSTPLIKRINFAPGLLTVGENYMLDRWYTVPMTTTFSQYEGAIICGLIKLDAWDFLPISAGLSGYWSDVSGTVSGLVSGPAPLSGDPQFLTTTDGDLLLVNDTGYFPRGMSTLDYYDFYLETLSGDLSGNVMNGGPL